MFNYVFRFVLTTILVTITTILAFVDITLTHIGQIICITGLAIIGTIISCQKEK